MWIKLNSKNSKPKTMKHHYDSFEEQVEAVISNFYTETYLASICSFQTFSDPFMTESKTSACFCEMTKLKGLTI